MSEKDEINENEKNEEEKIEIKEKEEIINNSEITNEEEGDKKTNEDYLIVSENTLKSEENENLNNNKDSSSPLIEEDSLKDDHYIQIERTKFLKIPYFIFGFTTHFYFPSEKLQPKIKLSEIPNPPFTLGENCKYFIAYIINSFKREKLFILFYSYFFLIYFFYGFTFYLYQIFYI